MHNLCNALISHKEPVSLIYFVTEACNANCPHCFVEFKSRENELSLSEIEKISESCGNSLRNIALTGGEPFLRDDLFDIAKIWWKNSTIQSVSVTTNGSMPDRVYDFAKKCAEEKIPVSFFFSYDFMETSPCGSEKDQDFFLSLPTVFCRRVSSISGCLR